MAWDLAYVMLAQLIIVLLVAAATTVHTQTPAPPASLEDFEGLYDYRDGSTLYMVVRGQRLFAVIGESKYALRQADRDTFLNGSGDAIPFTRDGSGRVVAFSERGDRFARRSADVPSQVRALFIPRPRGPDGSLTPYRYAAPPALADGLRAGEADASLSPAIVTRMVNGIADGTYPEVRSILVYHHNQLVLEEYFYGYDRDRPHQMRSLTKSVVSVLAGIAVDRGLLRADEPVLAKLGYTAYGNPDARKERITLLDLLSNQSGLACDDHDGRSPGNELKLYETADWAKAFVDLPMLADPGTVGRYCSGGFFTVGRIIERAARKPLAEFADEALLSPLGLHRQDWKWNFTLDRSQRDEFGQIYLRPRDMLKLGVLIQQRGIWQGRRIVSASWIEQAVARQSRVDDSDYGLGIWHRWYGVKAKDGDRRVDTVMLSGNGGQKIYLVPSLDLIVVFTGGAFNVESPVNEIMARVLLPPLLEADAAARNGLFPFKDPIAEMKRHLERLTGKEPLDCGHFEYTPRQPDIEAANVAAMTRALACGREAAAGRRAFFTFIGGYGVDSWFATGALGKADGTMMTFSFDSAPCGGPRCPSRFTPTTCDQPSVSRADPGFPGFLCHAKPSP
jgi:CubicO group peptidase (beta-lactamase class C family)